MPALLEHLDNLVLVLRENLSEPIGSLDEVTDVRPGHGASNELLRVVDVRAEMKLTGEFLADGDYTSGRRGGEGDQHGAARGAIEHGGH